MLFRIVRPMKRSASSHVYFVQRIPADIRAQATGLTLRIPLGDSVVEKVVSPKASDIRFSLRTRDPSEAKLRQAAAVAYLERVWRGLRQSAEPLTHKQIVALSGIVYRATVAGHADNPGNPSVWKLLPAVHRNLNPDHLEGWLGPIVDDLLLQEGVRTDQASRAKLIEEVGKAADQAANQLQRNAVGDYSPDRDASRFPEWQPQTPEKALPKLPDGKQSLAGILDGWWKEAQATGLSPKTHESYSATINRLIAFLGHGDAERITPDDVVRYKDCRLATINPRIKKPVSAKTVKDSDLAGLKAIFNWAVANRKMATNPAEKITVKLGKRTKLRPLGFTNEEAQKILAHALNHKSAGRSAKTHLAKRWIPWLCAYTGARVGEMVQLRKQDIYQQDGYWVLLITPEAGRVKDKEARTVPLHSHLVEQGFPELVKTLATGYLFIDTDENGKWEKRAKTLANRLRDFVREVVPDKNVQPNHGWRHRFKTLCREAQIDRRVMDEMQGHAPDTVSDAYGEVTVKAMANALTKFPRQGEE